MNENEKILKAMANRRRLAILALLKKRRGVKVGDIAREIGLSFKSTSRHLAILSSADIVAKDQERLRMYYHLVPAPKPLVRNILNSL